MTDVDRRYVIGAEVLVCSYCGALVFHGMWPRHHEMDLEHRIYTTSAEPTGPGQ